MSSEHSLPPSDVSPDTGSEVSSYPPEIVSRPRSHLSSAPNVTLGSLRQRPNKRTLRNRLSVGAGAGGGAVEKDDDSEEIRSFLDSMPEMRQAFDIHSKIGEGTFSSVYLASLKTNSKERKFAIKYLTPTSASTRVENEIYCLEKMGGKDHVISLLMCVRKNDHVAIVMPFFEHDKFLDYLSLVCVAEVQSYMRALFEALRNVHSHRIIHRDIKPSNFLYHRKYRRFQLVDFGLAHLEMQTKDDKGSILKANQSQAKICVPSQTSHPLTSSTNRTTDPLPPQSYQRLHYQRGKTLRQSSEQRRSQSLNMGRSQSLSVDVKNICPSSSLSRRGGRVRTDGGRGGERRQTVSAGVRGKVGGADVSKTCPGKHEVTDVCKFCMRRNHQIAPRAGTPGFRAPEVLWKCPRQTTSLDVWSAGIILLCLLSGRYPFFKAHDDMSAMAQIISLFGSDKCVEAAKSCGKNLICESNHTPADLKDLCTHYRATMATPTTTTTTTTEDATPQSNSATEKSRENIHHSKENFQSPSSTKRRKRSSSRHQPPPESGRICQSDSCSWNCIPNSAYDLMYRCLELNPDTRLTAEAALSHSFLTGKHKPCPNLT